MAILGALAGGESRFVFMEGNVEASVLRLDAVWDSSLAATFVAVSRPPLRRATYWRWRLGVPAGHSPPWMPPLARP